MFLCFATPCALSFMCFTSPLFQCSFVLCYSLISLFFPCFVAICFNVLCFTTSPCFVTPMLHCSMFRYSMIHYSHASCSFMLSCSSLVFHYSSVSLLLPCFVTLVVCHSHVLLLFIVSLFMCDIAFVLCSSHVLLLVTLLLLCDVTLCFTTHVLRDSYVL